MISAGEKAHKLEWTFSATDSRTVLLSCLALALGLSVLLAPYLTLSGRSIALTDDAYYYLLPAANFCKLGFYSFDGLTATNGFHPLWMALVTACALPLQLAGATDALPRVVLGLSIALTVWGALAWFGALRRGGVSGWIAGLMVVVTVISCRSLFSSGLETVCVFWSLGLLAGYLLKKRESESAVHPAVLAFYSLLVLFSRLDCGLFLLLLYVLLLLHFRTRDVLLAGVLLTLLATPYFVYNTVYHGAATPISGRVKGDWGDRYELETSGKTFGISWSQIQSGPGKTRLREVTRTVLPRDLAPTLKTLSLGFVDNAGKLNSGSLPILAIVWAVALAMWLRARRGLPPGTRLLAALGWTLNLFHGLSTLYYALSYDRVWPWYGAVGVMLFAAVVPLLIAGLLTHPRLRCLPCAALIILLLWWTVANARQVRSAQKASPNSLRAVNLDLADWIRTNTAENAVSAGWAVGETGWYAHRSVINLEGLVGDESLFNANRATDLLPFLARHQVTHITNFWRPNLAPLPEDLLAPAASDGAWKSGPLRYFWTMRLRPMIDCPEAFSVRYHHHAGDAQETSGYVLSVDQNVIARYLSARDDWRARIAACATVLPAENCVRLHAGQIEANLRRSEGYFVHGSDLVYSLSNAATGKYEVYGRVCNLSPQPGAIALKSGAADSTATIPPAPQWRHMKLGSISIPPGDSASKLEVASISREVFLDQLYLVSPHRSDAFSVLPADWWPSSPASAN